MSKTTIPTGGITDGILTSAKLDQDGAFTFNEDSADVDFRVESNGNANMLFVNGGTNKVGVGIDDPTGTFHVKSTDAGTTMFIEDTHAVGGDGPELYLYRNSATPAANANAPTTATLTTTTIPTPTPTRVLLLLLLLPTTTAAAGAAPAAAAVTCALPVALPEGT